MPNITINNTHLYYEDTGSGRETIVFAHSLLFNLHMFDEQVAYFRDLYRCVSFDFRGQGKSEVASSGYDMDTLTEDAAGLIRELDCAPCHFFGFSMGGFVGLRLALRHPELLKSLILADTSADEEPRGNLPKYRLLNFIARNFSLKLVAGRVMPIMFGEAFLKDPAREEKRQAWKTHLLANDRIGVTQAVSGVLSRAGVADLIHQVNVPTLIMVGEKDTATTPEKAAYMHQLIPDSRLKIIPRAGHMSPVEEPALVIEHMETFLNSLKV